MTSSEHPSGRRERGRHIAAERAIPLPISVFGREPLGLVCAALALAWVALVCRIASIW
ncbi:MAG: hypothetical protein J0G95_05995 [Rhizobiales bacterium]|nr:hypothetical protein [Hyphomicrobiales bacterium]